MIGTQNRSTHAKLNIQAGLILAFFISGRLATIADIWRKNKKTVSMSPFLSPVSVLEACRH